MFEQLRQIMMQVVRLWQRMTINQRFLTVAGVVAALFTAVMVVVFWTAEGEYVILYSELDIAESSRVVSHLEEMDVPYRLGLPDGTTILVPRDRVTRLRMEMAMEGLPRTGYIGYELLDRTTFGMTDFLIKKNYRRALEGELARTLNQLEDVESVSIHLVVPEPTVFTEREKPPTAAVRLHLRQRARLNQNQVQGITHLIASSVEGLDPSNITVVDNRGIQLNKVYEDTLALLTANQHDMKLKVENYLENKAQSMLASALGEGNAIIRVYVDLNYDQAEETSKVYGTTGTVVSEEREETAAGGVDSLGGGGSTERSITNYEVPETVRHVVNAVGTIKHLSVAIMLDDRDSTWVDGEGVLRDTTIARSPEEITGIGNLVRSAVGYDGPRGDHFEINSFKFSTTTDEHERIFTESEARKRFWINVAKVSSTGLGMAAVVVLLIVIVRAMSTKLAEMPTDEVTGALDAEFKALQEIKEEKEFERPLTHKKVTQKARKSPEDVAKTIKSLMKT